MIFQHTWEKVLRSEKTQTRRIVKPEHGYTHLFDDSFPLKYSHIFNCKQMDYTDDFGILRNGHSTKTLYEVGKTYAVQPGRGQKAVGRIRITGIRREDVRQISADDSFKEGFGGIVDFLRVWTSMHDKSAYEFPNLRYLYDRPNELYQAWVLTFELVKEA